MRLAPRRSLIRSLLAAALGLAVSAGGYAAERKISFSRDIKPILAGRCYACHGHDDKERQAEMRLDIGDEKAKAALNAGKPAESELVKRITSSDPDEQMPPAASKKPLLSQSEIDLIKKWIEQGAAYDAHWAYVKPVKAPLPPVEESTWRINEIDHFIAAGFGEHGLSPSPEADKRTLLRRLSFDVIGLPPTPKELAEFEADSSPQAYEKVVDRLLASKHVGERLAIYWLDVVRYADTGGYHSDNHRDVWAYRDWVVGAFNDNKPYNQFVLEQLAGDLLPNATGQQRIASGFNRLLQTTEEGGAQPKEYAAKYQADRVRNTSVIFLATTMGCCECHSHKFDPFTNKDFYSFAAFFADVSEKAVGRQDQTKVPIGEQEVRLKQVEAELAELRTKLDTPTPELAAVQDKWEVTAQEQLAKNVSSWVPVRPAAAESQGKQTLTVQDDLSVLASGENPAQDTYKITLPAEQEKITGFRLEALTDPSLTNNSLSRGNGNFVLTGVEVAAVDAAGKSKPVKVAAAAADFSQDDYPVANAIDGNPKTGWAINGHVKGENHVAVFTLAEPIAGGSGAKVVVKLLHQSEFAQHNIGKLRLSVTSADKPSLSGSPFPDDVVTALKAPTAERKDTQKQTLAAYYRSVAPELEPSRQAHAKLEAEKKAILDAAPSTLVSMSVEPRVVRILPRGNWLDDSGEIVQPAVPSSLATLDSSQRRLTRLDLAQWLVGKENPLTARVFVNRLWKLAFGRGIARSLEDFGTQSEYPTHPELLDWLAVDFQEHGWDIKRLYKQMLMSRTYRQSSLVTPELREKDPTNNWFARQDRFRLDAELVRDNALAVSGLLSRKIGGPSVKQYQPAGYWQYLNFPTREWQNDHGEDLYRRGLYTYWQRTFLQPSLLAFDASSREECAASRPRSNTPQQALVLLNDPTYVEAARALAGRVLKESSGDVPQRLEFLLQQVLCRSPRPQELEVLGRLYEKHLAEYKADESAATQFLSVGESKNPDGLNAAELAAWTNVCRVVLNLHETITRN
ncbi:MAG TPA: PSD1 and planctomycete cytochrome C domain-containing protein [Pirellulaceae bacterium]|nr:PSD1 and planctomycete cytochrome C domain-containing protein [Pirellulaceae bacterium]